MTADIEERVRSVLADVFGLDPSDVNEKTSPDTVDEWDSLQHLNLVLAIEEEFDLQFEETETTELVSFPLIVAITSEKIGTSGASA